MTKENLPFLTELALKSYREKRHPDSFAMDAALIISKAAAAKICPNLADDAVFVAAITSCINLSKYSATQAILATQDHDTRRKLLINESKAEAQQQVLRPDWNDLVQKIANISFGKDADALYQNSYTENHSENHRLARIAASNVYIMAWSASRVAYTYSIAIAARYSSDEQCHVAFKKAFLKRLSEDILNEPIEPSFFMQIIASDAIKIAGILLLVAGLAAMSLGICALVTAPIGIMLAGTVGFGGLEVAATGAALAATSGGLFIGRFFATRHFQNANMKSKMAVDSIHNFEPEEKYEPEPRELEVSNIPD